MTEHEILEFFNSPDRHQTNTSFPKCMLVKRDSRKLYAEFTYASGFEYCCFEWGCNIGSMEDLIADPEFGIDSVELFVKVEKGVQSSDKLLDKLNRDADTYFYSVRVPKKEV